MRGSHTMFVRALAGITVAGALLATTAPAAAQYSSHGVTYASSSSAGSLHVGARCYRISRYGDVGRRIADRFKRVGYRVHCKGGSIYVEVGSCPPKIRWSPGCYDLDVRFDGCYLILCPTRRVVHDRPVYNSPVYYPQRTTWAVRFGRPVSPWGYTVRSRSACGW